MSLAFSTARAELIYDNSKNDLNLFLSRTEEFGDEIDFAGTARVVTSMAFQVFGENALPVNAQARFRLYRANGPLPPAPEPQVPPPGDLLFQSADVDLQPGVQAVRIVDLAIPVPNRVMWTVEFLNIGSQPGQRAGLQVYHPPVVGRSFKDYWVKEPTRWRLYLLDAGKSASFAARFEALPDPPVTLTAATGGDGRMVIRITGPIGSEQVLEHSFDNDAWYTIGNVSLLTTNAAIFRAPLAFSGTNQFYRTRSSPSPGATVFFQSIAPATNGGTLLSLVGPTNTQHIVEASLDRTTWSVLGTVRFATNGLASFHDTNAISGQRFYRTHRPSLLESFLAIRSITRRPDGSTVLACTGTPTQRSVTVEASLDLVSWIAIGAVSLTTGEADFIEPISPFGNRRFYRLRQ
ncbi:MAG: hypothetical protein IT581_04600 [Verrucomicrobiales bacterium]|nr:hypothetical protein [Verrucomicrobiales bacterium]